MLLQKQLLRFVKNAPQKIMVSLEKLKINLLLCQYLKSIIYFIVSVCHVPHTPNSDFAVSVLSRLTGTIVVTEASRPVPKVSLGQKSFKLLRLLIYYSKIKFYFIHRTNRWRSLQLPILRRRNLQEVQRLQPRTRLRLPWLAQTNRWMVH